MTDSASPLRRLPAPVQGLVARLEGIPVEFGGCQCQDRKPAKREIPERHESRPAGGNGR